VIVKQKEDAKHVDIYIHGIQDSKKHANITVKIVNITKKVVVNILNIPIMIGIPNLIQEKKKMKKIWKKKKIKETKETKILLKMKIIIIIMKIRNCIKY